MRRQGLKKERGALGVGATGKVKMLTTLARETN